MPRVLYREMRFHVIDRCLRDVRRRYNIQALTAACNAMLSETYGVEVSLRTVQYDMSILRRPPYNIDLNEELLRQGYYRYADVGCHVSFIEPAEPASDTSDMISCTLRISRSELKQLETMLIALGPAAIVETPIQLRQSISQRLREAVEHYTRG